MSGLLHPRQITYSSKKSVQNSINNQYKNRRLIMALQTFCSVSLNLFKNYLNIYNETERTNNRIFLYPRTFPFLKYRRISNFGNKYLLIYRRRIPSKFFGANLPLTTNLCCPSREPLVPSSASKKAITWSGCRCILKD